MKSIPLPKVKKQHQDLKPLMEELELLLKSACVSIEVTNGNGKISISYAPDFTWRRIGPFGRCFVDLASERIDQLVASNFLRKGNTWNTLTKETVHVKSGSVVEFKRIQQ